MKIIFFGTNGWFDTKTGVTPCLLIDSKEAYIVLDAGNGVYKLDRYITDFKKPLYLFITHLHFDHIFGIHILSKFYFPQGMGIYVPQGMRAPLMRIFRHPFVVPPEKFRTKTDILELPEGKNAFPFGFEYFKLFHSSLNFGYRFTVEKKSIAYSGDTGICKNSIPFARNADVLIHECSNEPGHISTTKWGHVNPQVVATFAKEAHVHQLLLTHFNPYLYPTLLARRKAEKVAKAIFPKTRVMMDDVVVEI